MGKLAHITDTGIVTPLSYNHMLILLLHAVGIGFVLLVATFIEMKYLSGYEAQLYAAAEDDDDDASADDASPVAVAPKHKTGKPAETLQLFLGASNLLFLCVGLTGLMLLVNDNLARAFAIAAAIALVRFRVKLDQKSINASLLFAILAGMACGLDATPLAWTATGIYVVLFVLLLLIAQFIKPKVRD